MCTLRVRSGMSNTAVLSRSPSPDSFQMQQFVLLIQQVQAPEDLAAALPLPSIPPPQAAPLALSPSPSEDTPIAPANAVPTNPQNTNATAPSQQGVSFLSIVRFIFQLAWYDDHSRICTPHLCLLSGHLTNGHLSQGTSYLSCSPSSYASRSRRGSLSSSSRCSIHPSGYRRLCGLRAVGGRARLGESTSSGRQWGACYSLRVSAACGPRSNAEKKTPPWVAQISWDARKTC